MANTARLSVETIVQDASISYKSDDLVWDQVFVRKQLKALKQKIWVWNKGDQFRIPDDNQILRAPETESWRQKRKGSYVSLNAKKKSIGSTITDDDLRNEGLPADGAKPPVDFEMEAVENNADVIERWTENHVASTITAGTWADGNVGGEDANALWAATGSTNTFVPDILAAKNTMRFKGIPTNSLRLLIDYTTMNALKRVDEIKDAIQYSSPGGSRPDQITAELLAQYLELDKVIVAGAIKSTANEKADGTDFTGADIWDGATTGNGIGMLYHFPKQITRKMVAPALVATLPQLGGMIRKNKKWYEESLERWVYETTEENEVKTIEANAAYLWKQTHTAA